MFGILPAPSMASVILLGFAGLAVLVFEMLVGYRKIRFKGHTHMKVHKAVAWVILLLSLAHLILALAYLGFLPA